MYSRNKRRTKKKNVLKKQNCSPYVNGKLNLGHSCFTKKTLNHLKSAYNNKQPNNIITASDPKIIWESLSQKIPECDQESCWLTLVDNTRLRDKLKTELFAPPQPKEWSKNKNTWLSNYDINHVISQYEASDSSFVFIGPTSVDFTQKIENNKCVCQRLCDFSLADEMGRGMTCFGIIFNLDVHTGPGTHWVSLFCDLRTKSSPFLLYFNSTGELPPPEIKQFTQQIDNQAKELSIPLTIYENTIEHQQTNTECGMYSLFMIITMLTKKIKKKQVSQQTLLNLFLQQRIPDKHVESFRNIYFNHNV